MSSSVNSSLAIMDAATTSPHFLSAIPMTAHSLPRGCLSNPSSISKAEILYPPDFKISTEAQPKIL